MTTSSAINKTSNNLHTTSKTTTASTNRIQVTFADFEDLTSRLVLLPLIEDEGKGAVVASYSLAAIADGSTANTNNSKEKHNDNGTNKNNPIIESTSSDSSECRDEKEDRLGNHNRSSGEGNNNNNKDNLEGLVLVGATGNQDLKNADFASILSAMRGQPGPIVLELEQPAGGGRQHQKQVNTIVSDASSLRHDKSSSYSEEESENNDNDNNHGNHNHNDDDCNSSTCDSSSIEEDDDDDNDDEEEAQEQEDHCPNDLQQGSCVPATIPTTTTNTINTPTATNTTNSRWGGLSAWGSRMQKAAEAASQAAVQSYQAAAAASSRNANNKSTHSSEAGKSSSPPPCGLHVQTSLGAFLPLTSSASARNGIPPRSSELTVTSTSVLYIRKSAVEACPLRGYSYQWYKGLPPSHDDDDDDDDYDDNNDNKNNDSPLENWTELPGATSAAFQPSTTEVGYKLLCLVTVEKGRNVDSSLMDSDSDSEDDYSDSDDERDNNNNYITESAPTIVRCVTPFTVSADLSLFNGARQALVRGAHFSGLIGRGNAQGRTFRVQVEMGYQQKHRNNKKKRVASSVKVDQVSGETAEPLHADPFYHVTASTSHANPKSLELKFRQSDLIGPSLMSALVSSDGVLEMVAPNRFARESLLLAIGIANFKGKPADLEATTILYPPTSDEEENELEESLSEESSSSSSSGSGSCSYSTPQGEGRSQHEQQQPAVVESLTLSPTRGNDTGSHVRQPSFDSAGDLSTIASSEGNVCAPQQEASGPSARELELEREIAFLRVKLAKKDKVVSELQRHVTRSDAELQQANQEASQYHQKVAKIESELQSSQKVQRAAEQMVDQHLATMKKLRQDHSSQIDKLSEQVKLQESTIADLEKAVKSHQNEKAVLTAAVEAREGKLAKVQSLQEQFVALSSKVSQQDQWRKDLKETNQRYQELKSDLQKMTQLELDCRQELETTKSTLQSTQEELKSSRETAESCRSDLRTIQSKNQKLKSERNSYKQKADSLSKEISRICRNGRTLGDIERILANDEARQEEVQLLRKQKRKALEECHSYRKSYEQSKAAQELLSQQNNSDGKKGGGGGGGDPANKNTALLLERNVELERVVTDLTEYVNAKEMQLETMKQVNAALQEEIHGLAQANMQKNDI